MNNIIKDTYKACGIDEDTYSFAENIENSLKDRFDVIDRTAEINQLKVIDAMRKCRVSAECMNPTTGYGYDDLGRDTLEKVYARYFNTEDALVRPSITCGTHALTIALSALLRPGDEILCPAGRPYDTLEGVIGLKEDNPPGSLREFGITYKQVDLKDGKPDFDSIRDSINNRTRLVEIQKSKGYDTRPSLSVSQIGEIISFVKNINPSLICMVDNCYGEFVELSEPSDVGADICCGSLIKNPGGGLAPIGGYIAGRSKYIELCANRLTAPGLGKEVGASLGLNRSLIQGFFMGPVVTASALKAAVLASNIYESLGFRCIPSASDPRYDIIQSVVLGSETAMRAFCAGIQSGSPVDSFVTPEPYAMPGYHSRVIMAAGAFVQGSSIELSADGPVEDPYAVYFQGGLTYPSAKLGILTSLQYMKTAGLNLYKA